MKRNGVYKRVSTFYVCGHGCAIRFSGCIAFVGQVLDPHHIYALGAAYFQLRAASCCHQIIVRVIYAATEAPAAACSAASCACARCCDNARAAECQLSCARSVNAVPRIGSIISSLGRNLESTMRAPVLRTAQTHCHATCMPCTLM